MFDYQCYFVVLHHHTTIILDLPFIVFEVLDGILRVERGRE